MLSKSGARRKQEMGQVKKQQKMKEQLKIVTGFVTGMWYK